MNRRRVYLSGRAPRAELRSSSSTLTSRSSGRGDPTPRREILDSSQMSVSWTSDPRGGGSSWSSDSGASATARHLRDRVRRACAHSVRAGGDGLHLKPFAEERVRAPSSGSARGCRRPAAPRHAHAAAVGAPAAPTSSTSTRCSTSRRWRPRLRHYQRRRAVRLQLHLARAGGPTRRRALLPLPPRVIVNLAAFARSSAAGRHPAPALDDTRD